MNRTILTFTIGLPEPMFRFEDPVIKEVCALAGGCTVTRSIGYWMEDAVVPKVRYTGPNSEEFCLRIEVMCETVSVKSIKRNVCSCIKWEARRLGLDIDLVHITEHPVNFTCFSVTEAREL